MRLARPGRSLTKQDAGRLSVLQAKAMTAATGGKGQAGKQYGSVTPNGASGDMSPRVEKQIYMQTFGDSGGGGKKPGKMTAQR